MSHLSLQLSHSSPCRPLLYTYTYNSRNPLINHSLFERLFNSFSLVDFLLEFTSPAHIIHCPLPYKLKILLFSWSPIVCIHLKPDYLFHIASIFTNPYNLYFNLDLLIFYVLLNGFFAHLFHLSQSVIIYFNIFFNPFSYSYIL